MVLYIVVILWEYDLIRLFIEFGVDLVVWLLNGYNVLYWFFRFERVFIGEDLNCVILVRWWRDI